jgi:hypothetical protein
MKNQVIKNLTSEMGKEIIKYWQSRGVDTGGYTGEKRVYTYYLGVIDGKFSCYSHKEVMMSNAEIIELPKPLPQKVIAIDVNFNEFETYLIHEVTIGKPHLKYIVVTPLTIEYFENGEKYYMMSVPIIRQIGEREKKIKEIQAKIEALSAELNELKK